MPKVRPTHTGAAGGWTLEVVPYDCCVRQAALRGTATAADSGRGCSNLPARKAVATSATLRCCRPSRHLQRPRRPQGSSAQPEKPFGIFITFMLL